MNTGLEPIRKDMDELLAALAIGGFNVSNPKKIRCVFHGEKTPSAGTYKAKDGTARFHCHGCGFDGDVIAVEARITGKTDAEVIRARGASSARITPPPKASVTFSEPPPADPEALDVFARELGLSAQSVGALGFHRVGNEWRNPERDVAGSVIGYATRDDNGKKKCVAGSERGLTYSHPLPPGVGDSHDNPLIHVEGATDAAAGLDAGFVTIGRPGAQSGFALVCELARTKHNVIIGENDGGAGRDGAEKLAVKMVAAAASVRLIFPPPGIKDLRAWKSSADANGSDFAQTLRGAIANAAPLVPSNREATPMNADGFVPFPVDCFPEPLRSFVKQAAASIGCDPSYIALPLLSAAGGAIGNSRLICLKPDWKEPPIIWTAIIGESGMMKSPAIEMALGPIRARQAEAMRRHADAMKAYELELMQYDAAFTAWKRDRNSDEPPLKPIEPVAQRCAVDDVTVEALAMLLLGNPNGLLMARDELSGWIGGFDRYSNGKGGDVAKWLEMFGGRSITVDRKTGVPKLIYVPRAAVSIAGGIQPGVLRRALGVEHTENGLAARLLLAYPPRKAKQWCEDEVHADLHGEVAALFGALFALQGKIGEDGDTHPISVPLTPAGLRAFREFFEAHAKEQAALSGSLCAAWSKLEAYCGRIALIFHLIRVAHGDPTLTNAEAVDEADVVSAAKLVGWFGGEARRVYGMMSESDEDQEQRQLVELLARGSKSTRDLMRASSAYKNADAAEAALMGLVKAGLAVWEDPPSTKVGHPAPRRCRLLRHSDTDTTPEKPEKAAVVSVSELSVPTETDGEEWRAIA